MFDNADLIHLYTRADANRDGALIGVSATAGEAGFKYPVALTAAAWAKCVKVPPGVVCQDEAGRLWDARGLRDRGETMTGRLAAPGRAPPG